MSGTPRVLRARRALVDDPDTGGLVERAIDVVVDGSRIVGVHPLGEAPGAGRPGGPEVDDLGHHLLTPAFVDAHTHLALVGLRGLDVGAASGGNVVEDLFFAVERALTPDDIRAFARVAALEHLVHGTAVVWDHYYAADAVLEAMQDVGLAGVVGPTLQDRGGPGAGDTEASLDLTERLATRSPALADTGHGVAVAPHATDTVSDALWTRLADLAHRHHLPVHTHCAQSADEVRRAHDRARTSPLGLLRRLGVLEQGPRWLLVHGLFLTAHDLAALDRSRHTLVLCPSSQAQFGFPAPAHTWDAAGLDWVVATDGTATNDAADLPKELRATAALRTADGARSAEALAWHTTGDPAHAHAVEAHRRERWRATGALGDPASLLSRVWRRPGALHPALPSGRIATGHLAHLLLWDPHHPSLWPASDPARALAYGTPSPAIAQLMVAGRWRTPRGDHATGLVQSELWQTARAEATARREALLARL